ncbi:MAG: vWA domain-containing protein [Phycisphaerales bacterium]|jgi:Ca-activated chloride channel family protein
MVTFGGESLDAPLLVALAAIAIVSVAEWRHAARVARVARLAFGPDGRPAAWARLAPAIRIAGAGLAAFGAMVLLRFDPIEQDAPPNPRAARQLLVVLDVSPSMNLADAGPGAEKRMRGVWAGEVLRGVLDRLDMQDTRVSLVACYTKAVPMLRDSSDKEIVASLMDGLPLYTAFTAGETDLQSGIDAAYAMAKGWARRSTTLVVITDGDLSKAVSPGPRPASIADAIVIGVGDPNRATQIAGHASRQDQWSLKSLAAKLGAHYHEGNTRHLPSEVLDSLTMIAPRISDAIGLREVGLVSLISGASMLGLLGPLLLRLGAPHSPAAQPAASTRGSAANSRLASLGGSA